MSPVTSSPMAISSFLRMQVAKNDEEEDIVFHGYTDTQQSQEDGLEVGEGGWSTRTCFVAASSSYGKNFCPLLWRNLNYPLSIPSIPYRSILYVHLELNE